MRDAWLKLSGHIFTNENLSNSSRVSKILFPSSKTRANDGAYLKGSLPGLNRYINRELCYFPQGSF